MTITVTKSGTAVSSDIHFMAMSPWSQTPKITTHDIEGANFDILYHRGMHSASCTLSGYCPRTAANVAILNGLQDGSTISITHDVEGTRSGICTSLQQAAAGGGMFVTFSMTVVEQ